MKDYLNTSKMRTYSLYIITFFLASFNLLNAKNLQANFQYFAYQNNAKQTYIETYFTFLSTEINYKKVDENTFQGSILVELSIKNGDELVHIDKYLFNTPSLSDTLSSQLFIDKQIIALDNGSYTLDLSLDDVNSVGNKLTASTSLEVNFPDNKLSFSDVMLLDSYEASTESNVLSKSGYDLIPLANQGSYFLDDSESNLNFYVEWYNSEIDSSTKEGYLLNYYIENEQTHVPLTGFNVVKKKTPGQTTAHIGGFNLDNLVSGNYNFVINLLDKEGKGILQQKVFFQRRNSKIAMRPEDYASLNYKNSFVDQFEIIEQLAEHISSLLPIASQREWAYASNQLKYWDLIKMKQFFYGFWTNRNPLNPEEEWLNYYSAVKKANEMFSSLKIKGFATDRGYYYLKYGTADYIENTVHDNYTLPYQIWHYYKLGKQTNKIFIFAETALGTNDYELIHSTAQGELHNANWKDIVYRTDYKTFEKNNQGIDKMDPEREFETDNGGEE